MERSPLEKHRLKYQPTLPSLFSDISSVRFIPVGKNSKSSVESFPFSSSLCRGVLARGERKKSSAFKIALFFSGGPAPGGHNVIAGLFDALKRFHPSSQLIGFLMGAQGLLENRFIEIDVSLVNSYRNLGGFDMLGFSRKKLEEEKHFSTVLQVVTDHKLDGLVVIGGDDSNTNAAFLAEYLLAHGSKCSVVGVPKTIDGDLKNDFVETSFGFDTATKVYSEMIGNLGKDAFSAKKYTHFVKLMGRSASHVTLECFLQTRVNMAIIAEEILEKKMSLSAITKKVADLVEKRSLLGKDYGVILIPEGLFEFIPEIQLLMQELNKYLPCSREQIANSLQGNLLALFLSFPMEIQEQLISDLDPHGNIQLSHISTEKLLVKLVQQELKERNFKGKFQPVSHFFGYEGRCSMPSNFDANYCYSLGYTAFALISEKITGQMVYVQNLVLPVEEWKMGGVPILDFMSFEMRKNKRSFVIKKALVDLKQATFQRYLEIRDQCSVDDYYRQPGPLQLALDSSLCDLPAITLELDSKLKVNPVGQFN